MKNVIQRPEEGVELSETGVGDDCEHHEGGRNQAQVLWESKQVS